MKKIIIGKSIDKIIDSIENKKIKTAFKLLKIPGLRIADIARIKKEDIFIDNHKILIKNIRTGKKHTKTIILTDIELCDSIIELIEPLNEKDKIFNSSNFLNSFAKNNGFRTYDYSNYLKKKEKEKILINKN